MISSRPAARRPGPSSSGCCKPRKKPRPCKSGFAPCARRHSKPAPIERSSELAERIDRLSPREGPLRQAADRLGNAARSGHAGGWGGNETVKEGEASYLVAPTVYTETLAAVIAALQANIQEMIIENTLVERNGPVPPEYKKLVEDYYRVLSQDLR